MPGIDYQLSKEKEAVATLLHHIERSESTSSDTSDVDVEAMTLEGVYYNPRLDPKNFLEGPLSDNAATRLRQMLARPGIVVRYLFSAHKNLTTNLPVSLPLGCPWHLRWNQRTLCPRSWLRLPVSEVMNTTSSPLCTRLLTSVVVVLLPPHHGWVVLIWQSPLSTTSSRLDKWSAPLTLRFPSLQTQILGALHSL